MEVFDKVAHEVELSKQFTIMVYVVADILADIGLTSAKLEEV